jgi:SAM-dependent methyltransferase
MTANQPILALKSIPIVGPTGRFLARIIRRVSRKVRGTDGSGRDRYVFKRTKAIGGLQQIINLLNYTKTSGSIYNGQQYPAGYHTINLPGFRLAGQRNLEERFTRIPIDFTGKVVLDIGCNQGGMLFAIADKIAQGVGIDYDRRVVNAANKIRSFTKTNHLEFFTFDLQQDNIQVIRDLLPAEKVDIVFLLAVCAYLENWRQVIDLAADISTALLFEANGYPDQQAEHLAYLRDRYKTVDLLSEQSDDRHSRKLYYCQG